MSDSVVRRMVQVVLVLCAARAVGAQQAPLRGIVVASDGRSPARAVLVEATTPAGDVEGRTVTDSAGAFSLSVGAGSYYTLRAMRVGFRPTVVQRVRVDIGGASIRVVLEDAPIHIAAAHVGTESFCGVHGDSGKVLSVAWDEVRKGIALASTTPASGGMRADVLNWKSTHLADGSGAVWQRFSVDAMDASPRASTGAAGVGFARSSPGGAVDYLGPDAESLISDAFAASHCFRLVAPDATTGWLGIAFTAAAVPSAGTGIEGTFWVDTATAALRLVDYRFFNASRESGQVGAGGQLEFDRLATGEWYVRRWVVRLANAVTGLDARGRPINGYPARMPNAVAAAIPVVISGGTVQRMNATGAAALPPRDAWHARFVVHDSGSSTVGATVELADAGLFAVADSTGVAALPGAAPGRHTMVASTRLMRTLGVPGIRRTINIAPGSGAEERIDLPSERELLDAACGPGSYARGRTALFGAIDPLGAGGVWLDLVEDAARGGLRGQRWLADSAAAATDRKPVSMGNGVATDGAGRWLECEVPRNASVRVTSLRRLVGFVRVGPTARLVEIRVP